MRIKPTFTLAMLAMTIFPAFACNLRAVVNEHDSTIISDVYFIGTFAAMPKDGSLPFADTKSPKNMLGQLTVADQGMAFWSRVMKDYKRYARRNKLTTGSGVEIAFYRDATILGVVDHGTVYFFCREMGFKQQDRERISRLFAQAAVQGTKTGESERIRSCPR